MGVWIEIKEVEVYLEQAVVTPFVGVWIEMEIIIDKKKCPQSPPLWGCGLKYPLKTSLRAILTGHPLCGGVD